MKEDLDATIQKQEKSVVLNTGDYSKKDEEVILPKLDPKQEDFILSDNFIRVVQIVALISFI